VGEDGEGGGSIEEGVSVGEKHTGEEEEIPGGIVKTALGGGTTAGPLEAGCSRAGNCNSSKIT
jgi:hypothetical protein